MASSRQLTRIDAAIAEAKMPLKADCLRAERAGVLARRGELGEARQVISSLQMKYAANPHAVMSAWLAWGDGLLTYFSDIGSATALDRMRRAYALSGAARDQPLHALSAAWLALFEYSLGDYPGTARHVAEALTLAEPDHHSARSRACLVAAQLYHFGRRYDLAQPWYALGRQHAQAEGDDAAISALLHNMAWLHVSDARQAGACNQDPSDAQHMSMGAESTQNFDALTGLASLSSLVPILRAQVFVMQGEWVAALALFDEHISSAMTQGLEYMESKLRADMAWCHVQLGAAERAAELAHHAAQSVTHENDIDDRAAAHSRLAQVFTALGQPEKAAHHSALAEADWAVHASTQAHIVALLNDALAAVPPG